MDCLIKLKISKMKIVFLNIFVFLSQLVVSQDMPIPDNIEDKTVLLQTLEHIPIFPGCEKTEISQLKDCFQLNLSKHIRKTLISPVELDELKETIRVNVIFIINKEGNVIVKNAKSNSPDAQNFEAEAKRVIEKLPKMKPGMQNDKPVNVSYVIPISFIAIKPIEEIKK